jgi:peptidoglycan/LPS O-acetylase OafA/YrhL
LSTTKVYFPGLNALRFFAAFAVIITHIELIKNFMGYDNLWRDPNLTKGVSFVQKIVFELGGLGVVFFFVLSGFLITYLLLVEKEKTQTIEVKKFYLRRILRIWPLYYLIVILGFIVIPYFTNGGVHFANKVLQDNYGINLFLYLIIFPNVAYSIFPGIPHIGQTWSIGVEEQFYIIWPLLAKKAKNIFNMLVAVFMVMMLLKLSVLIIIKMGHTGAAVLAFKKFVAMSKIECMTIGGMGAYMLFQKKQSLLKYLYHPLVLPLSIIAIPILINYTPAFLQDGIHLIYSLVFLSIIINISSNINSPIKLENKLFAFLGKISYSIYMYHFMIIPLCIYFIKTMGILPSNKMAPQLILYVLVTVLTIFISWLSFTYFEGWFLKIKKKYTVIKSGSY